MNLACVVRHAGDGVYQSHSSLVPHLTQGTLGDDAASLKRWTNHMAFCLEEALEHEFQLPPEQISQGVKALHDALGWDASVGHVIPSAPLAAGTWDEAVETCSQVFQQYGLPATVAKEWHVELKNVHGADPPVIPDLGGMLQSCRDFGLIVAVCTSDDRAPTDNSLRNWNVTDLVDVRTHRTGETLIVVFAWSRSSPSNCLVKTCCS